MRRKRGIEFLGLLLIFFFTAYVAFIASNAQSNKNKVQKTSFTKKNTTSDSTSINMAKKLYQKASIEHLEERKMIMEKSTN